MPYNRAIRGSNGQGPGRGRGCGASQTWRGKLKGCGYRITIPRKVILEELNRKGGHLSAEDIFMKVHKVYSNIGLTTVYRTLELLVQMGMVSKLDFGDGRARYELVKEGEEAHHHHLICTECKKIIDYSDFADEELEFLERAEKGLSKMYNFEISNHIIQFYGICEKCNKKK